jgi:hypothetical protein
MGALSVVDRAVGTAAKTARGLADELEKVGRKQDNEGPDDDDSDERPTKIVVD